MRKTVNKTVVILWHNGGRLANQLWLFISMYAYTLEKGYKLENHSFFEYSRYFDIDPGNAFVKWFFFKGFNALRRFFKHPYNIFFRRFYKLYLKCIEKFCSKNIIYAREEDGSKYIYLPPSEHPDERITQFDSSLERKIYTDGWLFRNPLGVTKYREDIVRYFQPKADIRKSILDFLNPLRTRFTHIVGVHIRQGDYKTWQGGKYYFTQNEVAEILREYLQKYGRSTKETCFVICSDGQVDDECFVGLNMIKSNLGVTGDLFLLSSTDLVIGSSSTFGAFAAFYGKLQFITFQRPGVDWDYYLTTKPGYESKYYSINF